MEVDGSLSARRAWIEMINGIGLIVHIGGVALRKESVDRNAFEIRIAPIDGVALRKESVDRNFQKRHLPHITHKSSLSARRAWIEIAYGALDGASEITSLSARRAWIEMDDMSGATGRILRSLSARRAWIEICLPIG